MSSFDEWTCFRTEVRLNSIKSMTLTDNMAKLKDEFMSWAETEKAPKLLQWRLMEQFRLYEKQLQEVVDKHRAEFDKAAPSANYDHMCIHFLERELKEIIKQHGFKQSQAGIPILVTEFSATGYYSKDDISEITWAEARTGLMLGTTATAKEAEEQQVLSIEKPAQAQEKQAQVEEHQAPEDEQQAQEQPA
ncbi:zinc finger CCCH domain-containing protein 13-like [Dorcoceras hygrometricum]|uniref:Zinc finger CCCH domain-containing protein 13-like n=1 Tax=Dorcoceras hygrometricum TaxID=472368 RepID=A0A2Z7BLJ6_9LAMI|nr:zinc finger CCCH domain-containing protein 13-like [Dorcoceras hygrometricum]